MGLLELSGTINVGQFWPDGTSDADTTKGAVSPTGGFTFQGKRTRVFDEALVKRSLNAKSGKAPINKKGLVTVRFQGIDAPELHYRPTFMGLSDDHRERVKAVNKEFRQKLAETGTVALANFLGSNGENVPCVIRTAVSKPGEAFDIYGRLVGDIFVTVGHSEVNLNHWLLHRGWAFPALYNSMTNDEIDDVLVLARAAEDSGHGAWQHLSEAVGQFDHKLVFRRGGEPQPKKDRGPTIFPKLFRRVAPWAVKKKAGIGNGMSLLESLRASPDSCYHTAEFMKHRRGNTAPPRFLRKLHDFVSSRGSKFRSGPGELVFVEKDSVVVDARGRLITTW